MLQKLLKTKNIMVLPVKTDVFLAAWFKQALTDSTTTFTYLVINLQRPYFQFTLQKNNCFQNISDEKMKYDYWKKSTPVLTTLYLILKYIWIHITFK